MKTSLLTVVLPSFAAIAGVVLLATWTFTGTIGSLEERVPGLDGTPDPADEEPDPPPVAGNPIAGDGTPADVAGTWTAFRGDRRDAICTDDTPLARQWPDSGPPVLWTVELGDGYAGAAIAGGCAYVLDYDEEAQADVMRCFSMADGREVWRNSYPAIVFRNHGMSRTVPAIGGDEGQYVVSIGPRCHVTCWDAKTGKCHWLIDMVSQFGTEERDWYTGQCPLIDGDSVILAPCGGDALMIAVDLKSGNVLWQCPNPRAWKMTHSSIMPMEFAGRKMYVYCGTGGACGVSADDGKLLWDETTWIENFATSPSPLALPKGRILLSSGYDAIGAAMLQLSEQDGGMAVKTAFQRTRKQFNSEQHTPILYDGHIYAVHKLGGGRLVCLDFQGNRLWESGRRKFQHGPYFIADGMILALSGKTGLLVAAEATPEAYRELARFQAFDHGHEAWGPMAMVGGYLVLRDFTRMKCLDLRKK